MFATIQVVGNLMLFQNTQTILGDLKVVLLESEASAISMGTLDTEITDLYEAYLPMLQVTQELMQSVNSIDREILRYVIQDSDGDDELIAAHLALNTTFLQVSKIWKKDLAPDLLKALSGQISIIDDVTLEILETSSPTQLEELDDDARSETLALIESANLLRDTLYASIGENISEARHNATVVKKSISTTIQSVTSSLDNAEEGKKNSLLFSGLILLTVIMLVVILVKFVINPLKKISIAMSGLAQGEGDLTQRLHVGGKNELGKLAVATNSFIIRLDEMISQLSYSVVRLTPMSTELSDTMQQVITTSEEQRSHIQKVGSLIHKTMKMSGEVTEEIESISSSTQDSVGLLNTGKQVARDSITAMDQLVIEFNKANTEVTMLADDSSKIESIIDVINAISEQTNLLALNAAIEAARAGEAGRGFAVVADEVRNLASRTSESTLEVQAMILSIQNRTKSVTEAMNQGMTSATNNISLVKQNADSLEEVGSIITEINVMAGRINGSTQSQNKSFELVSSSVEEMKNTSKQNSEIFEKNVEFSDDLNKLSHKLYSRVNLFHVTNNNWSDERRSPNRPINDEEGKQYRQSVEVNRQKIVDGKPLIKESE
jgi:methyl-accepting chemotaxis protein